MDTSSSSSGGSSGGCDQACQDSNTGYGVMDTVWFLYNTFLVGLSSGPQNVSAFCPLGGTAQITGTTTVGTSISNLDLDFAMTTCRHASSSSYDLIFSGTVSQNGSFNNGGSVIAMTFFSSSLIYSGTAGGVTVSGFCSVSVSESYGSVTGSVCGRTFSY